MVVRGVLPHALLFTGKAGGEAFPLALSLARDILCQNRGESGGCGSCTSCLQLDNLMHPDLYFLYPVVKEGDKHTTSGSVFTSFRKLMEQEIRFTEEEWKGMLKTGNKQMSILVADAEELIQYTALKSFQSPHQVILIWMPERMRTETANKLLKLFEEPPQGVIFLAVSHDPGALLATIVSRFQRVNVPPIEEPILVGALRERYGFSESEALEWGRLSQGNLYSALQKRKSAEGATEETMLDKAFELLETARRRDPRLYLSLADTIAKMNRSQVLDLIDALMEVLRELNTLRYSATDASYLSSKHRPTAEELVRQLSPNAYTEWLQDLVLARKEIQQNASIKILFFDLIIHIARLFKR